MFSCHQKNENIATNSVLYSDLSKDPKNGKLMYKGKLYTGMAKQIYKDSGGVKMICGYVNGLKHGVAKRWYNNGVLNYQTSYVNGRKQGLTKVWYKNGQIQRETTYFKGVVHGTETVWYPTGEKLKERRLSYGLEKGLQKAWRKSGKLYANYEALNGRVFGLRGANMCYKIENETVKK